MGTLRAVAPLTQRKLMDPGTLTQVSSTTTVPLSWVFSLAYTLGAILLGMLSWRQRRLEAAHEKLAETVTQTTTLLSASLASAQMTFATSLAAAQREFSRELGDVKMASITKTEFTLALSTLRDEGKEKHRENIETQKATRDQLNESQTQLREQFAKDLTRIDTHFTDNASRAADTRHEIRNLMQALASRAGILEKNTSSSNRED